MAVITAAFTSWAESDLRPSILSLRRSFINRSDHIRDEARQIKELAFQSWEEKDYSAQVVLHSLKNNSIDFINRPFAEVVERVATLRDLQSNYYDRVANRFLQECWQAYQRDCRQYGAHRLREDARFLSRFFETIKLLDMRRHQLFAKDVEPRVTFNPTYEFLFILIDKAQKANTRVNDELPPAPPGQAVYSKEQHALEKQKKWYEWVLDESRYSSWHRSVVRDMLLNIRLHDGLKRQEEHLTRLRTYHADRLQRLIKRCVSDFSSSVKLLTTQHAFTTDMAKALEEYTEVTTAHLQHESGLILNAVDMAAYQDTINRSIVHNQGHIARWDISNSDLDEDRHRFEERARRQVLGCIRRDLKQHRKDTLELLDALNRPTLLSKPRHRQAIASFQQTILEQEEEDQKLNGPVPAANEDFEDADGLTIISHLTQVDIYNTQIVNLSRLASLLPRYRKQPRDWRDGLREEIERLLQNPQPPRIEDRASRLFAFWSEREKRRAEAWKDLPTLLATMRSNHDDYLYNLELLNQLLTEEIRKIKKEVGDGREKTMKVWTEWKGRYKHARIPSSWISVLITRLPRGGWALVEAFAAKTEFHRAFSKDQVAMTEFFQRCRSSDEVNVGQLVHALLTLQWLWMESESVEDSPLPKDEEEEKYNSDNESIASTSYARQGVKRQRVDEEPRSFFRM